MAGYDNQRAVSTGSAANPSPEHSDSYSPSTWASSPKSDSGSAVPNDLDLEGLQDAFQDSLQVYSLTGARVHPVRHLAFNRLDVLHSPVFFGTPRHIGQYNYDPERLETQLYEND